MRGGSCGSRGGGLADALVMPREVVQGEAGTARQHFRSWQLEKPTANVYAFSIGVRSLSDAPRLDAFSGLPQSPSLERALITPSPSADAKPATEAKKAKLATASSSKPKADTPATKKAAAKEKEKKEPSLVELKAGKFVLAQKALSWDATSSTMRGSSPCERASMGS